MLMHSMISDENNLLVGTYRNIDKIDEFSYFKQTIAFLALSSFASVNQIRREREPVSKIVIEELQQRMVPTNLAFSKICR